MPPKIKLKTQYALLFGALIILIAGLISAVLLWQFREFSKQTNALNAEAITSISIHRATEQGVSLAEQLASNLTNPLYYLDFQSLGQLIEVSLAHPDIHSVMVLDRHLRLIHKGGHFHKEFGLNIELDLNDHERYNDSTYLKKSPNELEIIKPVSIGEEYIGWVLIDYSLASIADKANQQTLSHQQRFGQNYRELIMISILLSLVLLVIGIYITYVLSTRLEQPILSLAHYARRIGQGNFDARVSVDAANELSDLADSLNKMASDLERHTEEIQFMAFHDSLTNLPNRRYLLDTLTQIIDSSRSSDSSFALLFIDIDNFKMINDRYGHDAGDFILTSVVNRVKHCVRSSDILSLTSAKEHEQPVLARLAGDEFVVILPQTRETLDAATVSERILEELAKPHPWQDSSILLSVSIGIACYPDNGDDAETLLRNADTAMYHVKKNNKNNYYFFSEELNLKAQQQRALLHEVEQALRDEEMELWFQPQLEIDTDKVLGAEALIRWRHPQKGIVTPDNFIPAIENSPIMHKLGLWIIQRALLFLRSCRTISPDITLSVNISASQLQNEQSLIRQLAEMAIEPELAEKLHLEITETFLLDDEVQASEALAKLQQMGFNIWLDDFGTGYSALNHLKTYPVDGVKIDKSFVQGVESQWENRTLTQAIISVADAFNIQAVAEGVETPEQKMILQGMGCKVAQGFLFARPMPQHELLDFLTSNLLTQGRPSQSLNRNQRG